MSGLPSPSVNSVFLSLHALLANDTSARLFHQGDSFAVISEEDSLHTCYMVTTDLTFVDSIIGQLHGLTEFCAVSSVIAAHLESRFTLKVKTPCSHMVYNGTGLPQNHSLITQPMMPEYWKLISDTTFYHPSQNTITSDLTNRDSAAVYVEGKPVSWVLTHEDNSIGMLYTLPHFRGNGFATAVTLDLCSRHIAAGITPHAYIVKGNVASKKLFGTFNCFHYSDDVYFCTFEAP